VYVNPFWSYRRVADVIAITNHLTGVTESFPPDVIDTIVAASAADDVQAGMDAGTLARLHAMNVLFDDRESGIKWFADLERTARVARPTIDQIELTNRCPYSCKMCPRTSSMTRSLGDMDFDLFAHILEQVSDRQKYVAMHHFGESLLHRRLPDMVRLTTDRNVATGLSCNPPSLKPALAARLLDAGISSLVLSFDSLDPASYRDIRGPAADVERAVGNIDALVRLRDAGGYSTAITVQLIHMHGNAAETERFLEFCREHGVDRGVVVRLGRWDFSDEKTNELGSLDTPLYQGFCLRPQQSVVVLWDGRVVACCHDYDGIVCLGDLNRQSLDEIWASAAAVKFRNESQETALCRNCAFSRSFRETRQQRLGIQIFHRDQHSGVRSVEYLSPHWHERPNLRLFDGFDILAT
jgi:radical SAM protein with 4Fe4S-binding SPASM domain